MYGMVNKGVQEFITQKFGEDTWAKVEQLAKIDDSFISMEQYPDEITYNVVGAICEVLKIDAAQALEAFGEYWVEYTGQNGYGPIMKTSGSNVKDFLSNLDKMHARIKVNMPHLQPPSFQVTDVTANTLKLHYHSKRAGLTPMILGLLRGVGSMFKTKVECTLIESRDVNKSHDIFLVKF